MTRLRTLVNNHNNILKCIALIGGYNLWIIYSSCLRTTVTLPLPVYVYNVPEQKQVIIPETITVTLHGTYAALRSLDRESGLHIDAAPLPEGNSKIPVTKTALMLPHTVRMLDYTPSCIEVTTHSITA